MECVNYQEDIRDNGETSVLMKTRLFDLPARLPSLIFPDSPVKKDTLGHG